MTLESFYFIAQIISAAAIIGSLLFVGLQIRANTREHRLVAANIRNEKLVALVTDISKDAALRDIVRRGSESFPTLSPDDAAAFSAHCQRICTIAVDIRTHRDLGAIDDTVWNNYLVSLKSYANSNGGRAWWRAIGSKAIAPYARSYLKGLFDPPREGAGMPREASDDA